MGRKAKLRRERNEHLPESWWSPTHGHVNRDNYKGCRVAKWDFEGDMPVILVNEETFQIHANLAYMPPGWLEADHAELMRAQGIDPDEVDISKTSF